jgi:acyl-CoA thioester hydrolase
MKVRDYECDVQGIVNNAVYQNYLEHSRHEFLHSLGLSFMAMHRQHIDPVVSRIVIDYKHPLRPEDTFVSKLRLTREGAKHVFYQDIIREADNKPVISAKIEIVTLINGKLSRGEKLDEILERASPL